MPVRRSLRLGLGLGPHSGRGSRRSGHHGRRHDCSRRVPGNQPGDRPTGTLSHRHDSDPAQSSELLTRGLCQWPGSGSDPGTDCATGGEPGLVTASRVRHAHKGTTPTACLWSVSNASKLLISAQSPKDTRFLILTSERSRSGVAKKSLEGTMPKKRLQTLGASKFPAQHDEFFSCCIPCPNQRPIRSPI